MTQGDRERERETEGVAVIELNDVRGAVEVGIFVPNFRLRCTVSSRQRERESACVCERVKGSVCVCGV